MELCELELSGGGHQNHGDDGDDDYDDDEGRVWWSTGTMREWWGLPHTHHPREQEWILVHSEILKTGIPLKSFVSSFREWEWKIAFPRSWVELVGSGLGCHPPANSTLPSLQQKTVNLTLKQDTCSLLPKSVLHADGKNIYISEKCEPLIVQSKFQLLSDRLWCDAVSQLLALF